MTSDSVSGGTTPDLDDGAGDLTDPGTDVLEAWSARGEAAAAGDGADEHDDFSDLDFSEDPEDDYGDPEDDDDGFDTGAAEWLWVGTQLLFMVGFLVLAGYLGWSIRDDIGYWASDAELVDLGRAEEVKYAALQENTFVAVKGITTNRAARASVGVWFLKTELRYFLLAGSRIFLQVDVDPEAARRAKENVGEVVEDATGFYESVRKEGRLVNVSRDPDYAHVVGYFEALGYDFADEDYWMVVSGEAPGAYYRYPLAILVLLGLCLVNLFVMFRTVRGALANG